MLIFIFLQNPQLFTMLSLLTLAGFVVGKRIYKNKLY